MKPLLIILFVSISTKSLCQYKIVKVESENFYLKYYYKKYKSDFSKGDSIYYLCKKISENGFYLVKFYNKKKEWIRQFKIELANDSLMVSVRKRDTAGSLKTIRSKVQYFVALQVGQEVKK